MTQNAIVTRIIDEKYAEVSVERMSACGENCASCGAGCGSKNIVRTSAINKISARPGDRVMIESKTGAILGAAALVYFLPLAAFLLGYALAFVAGMREPASIAVSIGAFLLGVGLVYYIHRHSRRKVVFTITGLV